MPAEPWTLQPSPSTSSLGSAGSTGRRVGAGVGLGLGLGVPTGGASNNISNKPNTTTTTSRSSLPGSSIGNRLSSSNSDTLHSSSEDESTTLPGGGTGTRARGASVDASQLAVAIKPLLGVRSSPSSDLQQQYQLHYYQQQQQQQQQQQYGYFDASGQGAQTPGAGVGIGTRTGTGVEPSSSSGRRVAETIIHFPDHIPTLRLVSFTPPPSSPVVGSFSSTATPNASYAHNYSHPHPHHPHQQVPHYNADAIAPPSSSSARHHHPLPSIPSATTTTATTTKTSYVDESGVEHSSKFQAIRKRFSMGAATATGLSGGPTTAGGGPDRIERRTSLTNNNNSSNNNREPPTAVRQYTKDSTKTLTSESTTGLFMREELKDDSSLMHNKAVGAGVGGMGLAMNERTFSAASGAIHFHESEYAGVTRRGSTMTTASDNTQTTYRLNVHIPPHHTDYYPEKDGYDTGSNGKSHSYNYNPINLSSLSPTAIAPTSPITLRRDSLFGLAGSNNNNPAPNGKRYIDTRKRNKKQKKEEKALAKASFKKAKTLFSNERTFIHWIKFGMLLGALAMTLLNFSGDEVARRGVEQTLANRVGRIGKNVGVTLLLICLLCLLYAALSYHWRHLGIAKDKGFERYFDRVGPTFLTVALLATYTINIVLTIQVSSLMDRNFEPSSIFLNNDNVGQHSLQPLAPPPSIPPPIAGVNQAEPLAPPPPPLTQPQKTVFDTPYLPPGSTILIDSDKDDGSDFEFSHPPSDLEDPTVTTASSTTESSSEEGAGPSSSRDESKDSNASGDGDEGDDDN